MPNRNAAGDLPASVGARTGGAGHVLAKIDVANAFVDSARATGNRQYELAGCETPKKAGLLPQLRADLAKIEDASSSADAPDGALPRCDHAAEAIASARPNPFSCVPCLARCELSTLGWRLDGATNATARGANGASGWYNECRGIANLPEAVDGDVIALLHCVSGAISDSLRFGACTDFRAAGKESLADRIESIKVSMNGTVVETAVLLWRASTIFRQG